MTTLPSLGTCREKKVRSPWDSNLKTDTQSPTRSRIPAHTQLHAAQDVLRSGKYNTADKMDQWVRKALVVKPDNLSSTPGPSHSGRIPISGPLVSN